jgi:cyanate lyase
MSAPLPAYCTALLAWKTESNLTFSAIAEKLGRPEVWTTALFFGQAKTDEETAQKLLELAGTPADGLVKYATIDDPSEKTIPASSIIKGLCGKGVDSKGVDGMITRGGTWEWPPKVRNRVGSGCLRMMLTLRRTRLSTDCTRSWSCTGRRTRLSSTRR